MISVFVYGTLLVGQSNHHVVAPYLLSVRAGAVRGFLYDYGTYPGLVLSDAENCLPVEGEWLLVTPEGLERMDELEDYYGPGQLNDYERVWVRDARDEGLEGWVYVWEDSRGCPLIPGGSWRRRHQPGSS
ncbi:gamma-glutamylcyclotransferase family protein [Paenibacillus cremeus]|uniref:Gamma-glutamylcyclotransferase n=1 Tax=Paenibacillus cremeus TaxID=2163881 RepID=A0A559K084_9BACL|nr:gamma-glutamylcyclotransferase family protein [Paenibacillus cremeus]TVY05506.1 gamma-glutamylcyclotransferase [Paenibacillus cremeus]